MVDWSSFTLANSAGFIKGPGNEFDDMLRSAAHVITVGSITLLPRGGNPGNVYWPGNQLEGNGTSVNALGLPNPGLEKFLKLVDDLAKQAHTAGKKLRVSVAGFEPGEYATLAEALSPYTDELEINLGCPNVWGAQGQKPIASFDVELLTNIINVVRDAVFHTGVDIVVKVSPFSDPSLLARVAMRIGQFEKDVQEVVTCNTFPNGIAFHEGRRVIDMPYGGVGGTALREIALGQVAQFVDVLKNTSVKVVGVGGISRGVDVWAMREVGASGVQIGTAFSNRRARIFSEVMGDLD